MQPSGRSGPRYGSQGAGRECNRCRGHQCRGDHDEACKALISSSSSSSSSSSHGFLHPLPPSSFHQVKLKDYGSKLIEVSDNGSGVKPSDFKALTLKYHTSKIQGFDDLATLSSYGFRGEALSSLCSLCDKLSVVTRAEGVEVGSRIEFDPQGTLVSTSPCARAQGTTVTVKGLFKPLPVRHKVSIKSFCSMCGYCF
jgi:hypothetical protein